MLMLGYKERSEFQLRVGLLCCGKGCEAWQASHAEGVAIIPILSLVHMSLDKVFYGKRLALRRTVSFSNFLLQLALFDKPCKKKLYW